MRRAVVILVLVAAMIALTGCPLLGVDVGTNLGTLVVHNDLSVNIKALGVVRLPDECSQDSPSGVNILPTPIKPGESFTVRDLAEGRYYCQATYVEIGSPARSGYLTLTSGATIHWYVTR